MCLYAEYDKGFFFPVGQGFFSLYKCLSPAPAACRRPRCRPPPPPPPAAPAAGRRPRLRPPPPPPATVAAAGAARAPVGRTPSWRCPRRRRRRRGCRRRRWRQLPPLPPPPPPAAAPAAGRRRCRWSCPGQCRPHPRLVLPPPSPPPPPPPPLPPLQPQPRPPPPPLPGVTDTAAHDGSRQGARPRPRRQRGGEVADGEGVGGPADRRQSPA